MSVDVSEDAFKGPFFVDTQTMTLTLKDSNLKIGNVRHMEVQAGRERLREVPVLTVLTLFHGFTMFYYIIYIVCVCQCLT